jgi:predicted DNA-binding transcriptional regulator AlpA
MLTTFDELASILQADVSTTLQLIADGDVPAPAVIGDRIIRWPTTAIAKWVDANCPASAPLPPDKFQRVRSLRLLEWANSPEGLAEITRRDKAGRQQRRRANPRKTTRAVGNVANGKQPGHVGQTPV